MKVLSGATAESTDALLRTVLMERQRLLIREANHIRVLLGLTPVRTDHHEGEALAFDKAPRTD